MAGGARDGTGMDQAQMDAFLRDFWDVYCGAPNTELAAYFRRLRPRYRTALLSNSFVGARREEEARFHFAAMTDLIVYSHEEGLSKPDPRIFERAWQRLGVLPDETIFLDDVERQRRGRARVRHSRHSLPRQRSGHRRDRDVPAGLGRLLVA